jgi:uncharacterized protein with ParB-like and HNH nuclease domain
MSKLLDSDKVNLDDILGNGKQYKVPDFQRDYSWSEENWEDLWFDMVELLDKKSIHYMGSIVLLETDSPKKYLVVDGQQRLTTLSLFILAVINFLKSLISKKINPEQNQDRIEVFKNKYIGTKPATTLFYTTKLELNKNNNSFYKQYLTEFKEPINVNKLKSSDKLLYNAYKYFCQQIQDYFKEDNGEKISSFLEETIATNLNLIQITVDDDLSAYTVFETLNARGVDLTSTDLLKNYLFSLASKDNSSLEILLGIWQQIVDSIGFKDFPNFLRYYINSKQNLVRHNRLYKEIKSKIKTPKDVYDLLEDLKEFTYLYLAIKNPNDDFWFEHPKYLKIKKSLQELNLFGVSQPTPVLFAAYKYIPNEFDLILEMLVVISFRYNVIGKLTSNELEKAYNKVARKISNGEIKTKKQIFESVKNVYVLDETFESAFASKIISTKSSKKIVRYILIKLENQLSNSNYNIEDSEITIEHILPESWTEKHKKVFGDDIDSYIYRLGNYTLLDFKDNKKISNKTFEEKRGFFENNKFKLSSDLNKFEDWDSQSIISRQKSLAKIAKYVWKIQ